MPLDDHESPFLKGNYAPVRDELDVDLVVAGDMPAVLDGTLYRIGPNPQFNPIGPHHWFHGDGMAHAFSLREGKARYTNRFVRTPKWIAENTAGRCLSSQEQPQGVECSVANTNILWHGGRLLALEEMHAPVAVDHKTLATLGSHNLGGAVTAHPKLDPETSEMVFFAFSAGGRLSKTIDYGVADATGRLVYRESFEAPFCSMIHDFIVTRDHVLFPVMPLAGDLNRAMAGGPAFAWEPDKGAFVGVLRRGAPLSTIRWFETAPQYVYHVMNAWDAEGLIISDVMSFESAPLFPNPDGSPRAPSPARLKRWTIDLNDESNQVREALLDDTPGEFPRFDERRSGLPYRHGWFAAQREHPGAPWFDRLAHVDLERGGRQIWEAPQGDAVAEPVFVPRSPLAAEGDGWITTVIYRGRENTSELAIFEALDLARGPIATARVPRRVPFGFHGNWRPRF